MSDATDISITDWNRLAAKEELESLKSLRATAWEEHSHSYRWLVASLLAINGGACLGIFGQDSVDSSTKIWSCGAFLFGILCALLVATTGQFGMKRLIEPLQKMIGYWITVEIDGERDSIFEDAMRDELKVSNRWAMAAQLFGWCSALAFLAGAVTVGKGIEQPIAAGVEVARPDSGAAS